MDKAIENLNKTMQERENMVNALMRRKNCLTDAQYDREEAKLMQLPYKTLKNKFDKITLK